MITREHFYRNVDDRMAPLELAAAATAARRTRWRSRDEAHTWLARRIPWKSWDARVARPLSTHGLAEAPGGSVVLKCALNQEALGYADTAPQFAAAEQLGRISHAVPVHLVWARDSLVCAQLSHVINLLC